MKVVPFAGRLTDEGFYREEREAPKANQRTEILESEGRVP
jgi:hypothetical protein